MQNNPFRQTSEQTTTNPGDQALTDYLQSFNDYKQAMTAFKKIVAAASEAKDESALRTKMSTSN